MSNVRLLSTHPSYRKRAVVSVFAYLGALATVLEVIERTAGDQVTTWANNLWVVIGTAVAGSVVVLFSTLPSNRYEFVHGSYPARITIEVRDLLSAPDDFVVLTANRFFDSVPIDPDHQGDRSRVAAGSLIAQLGRRWFPTGDGRDIERMITTRTSTTPGTTEHPVGTVVELHGAGGERVVLLGVSRRGDQKLSTVLIDDIWTALSQLWAYARRTGPRSIALPVIGSGYANAEVGPNPLLMLLITSYVTAAMEEPVCPIRIVLPRDAHDLSAFEVAQSYCESLGFKGHR
jgi:hypothetical protein